MKGNNSTSNGIRENLFFTKTVKNFADFLLFFIKYFYPQLIALAVLIFLFWNNSLGQDVLYGASNYKRGIVQLAFSLFTLAAAIWFSARVYVEREMQYNNSSKYEVGRTISRILGSLCFGLIGIAVFNYWLLNPNVLHDSTGSIFFIDIILMGFFIFLLHLLSKSFKPRISSHYHPFLYIILSIVAIYIIGLVYYLPKASVKESWTFILPAFLLGLLQFAFYLLLDMRTNTIGKEEKRTENYFQIIRNVFKGDPILSIIFFVLLFIAILIPIINNFSIETASFITPCSLFFCIFSLILVLHALYRVLRGYWKVSLLIFGIVMSFILGATDEPYLIRTCDASPKNKRESLVNHFETWLDTHHKGFRTDVNRKDTLTLYVMCANGGGLRASYWTSSILDALDSLTNHNLPKHLLAFSGASGGNMGGVSYACKLKNAVHKGQNTTKIRTYIHHNYLSYTLSRFFIGDILMARLGKCFNMRDRMGILEDNFAHYQPFMDSPFETLADPSLPMIFVNTTRMNDCRPAVVSNILIDEQNFPYKIDVLSQVNKVKKGKSLRISTGMVLGARFPFISPAGALLNEADISKYDYYVDGGFYDNAGAGTMRDMLWALYTYYSPKKDISWFKRINFCLISVPNTAGNGDTVGINMLKISNDWVSPINTLMGGIGSQATGATQQLKKVLDEMNTKDGLYYEIRPTKDINSIGGDFPLNWFLSERVYSKMDKMIDSFAKSKSPLKKAVNVISVQK